MDKIGSGTSLQNGILDGYVTLDQLSKDTNKSKRFWQRLKAKREGPPRLKVGRLILYNVEAVRQWLESHTEDNPEVRKINPDIKSKLLAKKITLAGQK